MATKTAQSEERQATGGDTPDGPLLDMSDAAVKRLIKTAKTRGYVTYDELNEVLPSDKVSSEQIEDTMSMFSDMGINVVESEDAEANEEKKPTVVKAATPAKTTSSVPAERTDDPVRMYLREMGSVELLSREGEIAIAKRIEAGRGAMIAGLCESPLTFQAIIIWRDELNEGRILLRDIIDLEATYAGPDAKIPDATAKPPEGAQTGDGTQAAATGEGEQKTNGVDRAAAPNSPEDSEAEDKPEGEEGEEENAEEDDDDDDDMENSLSLAAMEAELKPQVLEIFDSIAGNYKKLRRLQDQVVEKAMKNKESITGSQQKRYDTLKDEIVVDVKSLCLNNNRIEALVDQLYGINRRLLGFEGRLMRLADSHAVSREDFLAEYQGNELDPNWLRRVGRLKKKGWEPFVKTDRETVKGIRKEVSNLATETGLQIGEFRRIVHIVQKGEREAQDRQEGDGGGQSAARDLDRQEIHQPRPAIPRPDPGRQYRPDEGGRQIRISPRL